MLLPRVLRKAINQHCHRVAGVFEDDFKSRLTAEVRERLQRGQPVDFLIKHIQSRQAPNLD